MEESRKPNPRQCNLRAKALLARHQLGEVGAGADPVVEVALRLVEAAGRDRDPDLSLRHLNLLEELRQARPQLLRDTINRVLAQGDSPPPPPPEMPLPEAAAWAAQLLLLVLALLPLSVRTDLPPQE